MENDIYAFNLRFVQILALCIKNFVYSAFGILSTHRFDIHTLILNQSLSSNLCLFCHLKFA